MLAHPNFGSFFHASVEYLARLADKDYVAPENRVQGTLQEWAANNSWLN